MGAELRDDRGAPPGLARVQADVQRAVDAGEVRLPKPGPGATRPPRAGRGGVEANTVKPLSKNPGAVQHVDLRQWAGDSRGHWEGETLVVETTNFLRETSFLLGQSDAHLHLVERFTRVSPETLMYEATIDDPTVWSRSWTFQIPMQLNDQPLYEYACHEGNYGLANILSGARFEEGAAEAATPRSR